MSFHESLLAFSDPAGILKKWAVAHNSLSSATNVIGLKDASEHLLFSSATETANVATHFDLSLLED